MTHSDLLLPHPPNTVSTFRLSHCLSLPELCRGLWGQGLHRSTRLGIFWGRDGIQCLTRDCEHSLAALEGGGGACHLLCEAVGSASY
jgi:hypothetical protein